MFSTVIVNGIGIKSSWKKELSVSSQSCQCDPYYTREEGSQHPDVSSIGIQSYPTDSMNDTYVEGSGRSKNVQGLNSIQGKNIDLNRLNDFLRKGEKVIQREIRKSIKNVDDWKHINRIHGTSTMDATCLHTIYSSDHLFTDYEHSEKEDVKQKTNKAEKVKHHHLPPEEEEEGEKKKECKMDEIPNRNKFIISCLTWNCSSSMIGVSYEVNVDHSKSWCSHESFFCLWNLYRSLDHDSKPSIILSIDGCITCTTAHPYLATIYAIGTRSGKVFVVNSRFSASVSSSSSRQTSCKSTTSSQESSSSGNYIRSSNPTSVHHSDSVTCTHWIPGTRRDNQQLVSIGMDGKIFVWLMDGSSLEEGGQDTKDLLLSQAFVILVESCCGLRPNVVQASGNAQQRRGSKSSLSSSSIISEQQRRASVTKGSEYLSSSSPKTERSFSSSSSSPKTESSSSSACSELGIISSCFSRDDPYNFLVGCVGGSLFLCSLDAPQSGNLSQNKDASHLHLYNALEENVTKRNISFFSPIRISYVPHRNNVNSVEFCSTSRKLFVSGSIDGEVRVYDRLNIKPLSVLHVESGLRSVSWSVQSHETRHSAAGTKAGSANGSSSEFETFLYCLLQNGLLASFHFSLVSPSSSSSSLSAHSHSSSSSTVVSSSSLILSHEEENNKLHPVAKFPLPRDDQMTQGITCFSFNHFGSKSGGSTKLVSIATGRGVVSIWQLL